VFPKKKTSADFLFPLIINLVLSIDMKSHIWLNYDMVFTSPPYFNIEQYNHMPLKSKQEWAEFYHDLFSLTYKNLAQGGVYAINCSIVIFNISLRPLLGER
jgi:DNA modification methylase